MYSRDKESGYKETDEPNPATIYAQQKVKVERHLLNLPRAGIIRLGRNVGWSQSNFYCPVQLTYNALLSGQAKMAADNLITLTDVRDSVKGILHAANIEFNGILHLASEPPICRTALADRIIQTSRQKRAMSYEKILFSELGFDETKSRAAWLDSTLSCEELGCVYRTPTDVISEKVCAIDEWQTQ